MNSWLLPHLMIAALVCGVSSGHGAEWLVTNLLNSGPGSLRQQIADAQGGDTITFASHLDGGSVALADEQIVVSKELRIDASALPSGISVARSFSAPRFRLFLIDDFNPATKLKISISGVRFSGGISPLGGAILNSEDLELTDCHFVGNRATGIFPNGRGGAILNQAGAAATITRSRFEDNDARMQGGAVCNQSSSPIFANCSFVGNSSLSNAGAIFNEDSHPEFISCQFLGNQAVAYGGAVLNIAGSSPRFTNCTFSRNRSTGEIGGGGAIFNLNASNPKLLNCSIAGNRVTDDDLGGTIYNAGSSPVLVNCILWGNEAGIRGSKIDDSSAFNLIEGQPDSQNPVFVRDPGSLDAHDFGDLRLRAGSPAINSGDGGQGASMNGLIEDVMGRPRFLGGRIDIGAFEGENLVNFSFFYGDLDPDEDDNRNGLSNFVDYATGADPRAPHDPGVNPGISRQQVSFSYRTDAEDVVPSFQKSNDLITWSPLIEDLDFTISSLITVGPRTIITFDLITPLPPNSKTFFRTDFTTAAP